MRFGALESVCDLEFGFFWTSLHFLFPDHGNSEEINLFY
jgi:hypothetical protein